MAAAAAAAAAVAAANRNQFSLPKEALSWVAKNRCNPHAAYEVALRELGAGTLLTDYLDNYLTRVSWNAVERRTNSYADQLALFSAGQDARHPGWQTAGSPEATAAAASLAAETARLDTAYPVRPFNARAGSITEA